MKSTGFVGSWSFWSPCGERSWPIYCFESGATPSLHLVFRKHVILTIAILPGAMATLPPRVFPLPDDIPSGCIWPAGAVVEHNFAVLRGWDVGSGAITRVTPVCSNFVAAAEGDWKLSLVFGCNANVLMLIFPQEPTQIWHVVRWGGRRWNVIPHRTVLAPFHRALFCFVPSTYFTSLLVVNEADLRDGRNIKFVHTFDWSKCAFFYSTHAANSFQALPKMPYSLLSRQRLWSHVGFYICQCTAVYLISNFPLPESVVLAVRIFILIDDRSWIANGNPSTLQASSEE